MKSNDATFVFILLAVVCLTLVIVDLIPLNYADKIPFKLTAEDFIFITLLSGAVAVLIGEVFWPKHD